MSFRVLKLEFLVEVVSFGVKLLGFGVIFGLFWSWSFGIRGLG